MEMRRYMKHKKQMENIENIERYRQKYRNILNNVEKCRKYGTNRRL